MAQHAEPTPFRQRKQLLQIGVDHGVVIGVVPVAVNVKQIKVPPVIPGHMGGADDEIQLRCRIQQVVGPVEAQIGLAQFRTQLQPDAAAILPPGFIVLCLQRRPVVCLPGLVGPPLDGIHMVGEAQLVETAGNTLPGHFRHGQMAVRRAGGVYMIISQIHQRFLKKLFRFS